MGKSIFTPSFKLWLKKNHKYILGEGGAHLLKEINKYGSISRAAKQMGLSYKHAWKKLINIEKNIGQPILRTKRGGKHGGGTELTEEGIHLLKNYYRIKNYFEKVVKDNEYWKPTELKSSARNQFKGVVKAVKNRPAASSVKIKIKAPIIITAIVAKETIEELGIKRGDNVKAVIKATEVMITK
jgi:molybdate transport system regulatory protein